MSLYLPNGYVNMEYVFNQHCTFNMMIAARGTGKTYGAIDYFWKHDEMFLYSRRLQDEADMVSIPELSPFMANAEDLGKNLAFKKLSKFNSMIYEADDEGEAYGSPIALTGAITSMSKVRGINARSLKALHYDEFVPEQHARAIRGEGRLILNAYETLNRNREIDGLNPMKFLATSNSDKADNPLFAELGIVDLVVEMQKNGQVEYINHDRDMAIFVLQDSPISRQKQETALYRCAGKTSFAEMALNNKFTDVGDRIFQSIHPKQLIPYFEVSGLYAYKVRSGGYYMSSAKHGAFKKSYGTLDRDLLLLRREQSNIWLQYIKGNVVFDNFGTESIFRHFYGVK